MGLGEGLVGVPRDPLQHSSMFSDAKTSGEPIISTIDRSALVSGFAVLVISAKRDCIFYLACVDLIS